MKMLTAIIRPERLDDVVEALKAIGKVARQQTDDGAIAPTRPIAPAATTFSISQRPHRCSRRLSSGLAKLASPAKRKGIGAES